MTEWSRFLRAAGVCLLVRHLDPRLGAGVAAAGDPRAPARVYTNEDLARVSGRRAETGVESRPAAAAPAASATSTEPAPGGGEPYWRGETERLRRRLDPWRDAAADLRADIAARQAAPGVRPYTDPQVRAWQRRLEALEARIRDAEDRFEERARRARALPGWLR
jgi:hypothetical protein